MARADPSGADEGVNSTLINEEDSAEAVGSPSEEAGSNVTGSNERPVVAVVCINFLLLRFAAAATDGRSVACPTTMRVVSTPSPFAKSLCIAVRLASVK